jgi:outer membrane protein OmpA-like peptidoglycan-associated protein
VKSVRARWTTEGRAACLVALAAVAGCGRPPRPAVMADTERARQGASAQEAAGLAPEGFAHAEKLRRDAERAYDARDVAGAQILSEHALAAYQHATVLARIARAQRQASQAQSALAASQETLAQTEGEQKRIAAEVDDLTLRIKVIRDAAPIASVGPADPAREKARLASSRSLALDARLLCAAAQMLDPKAAGLADAQKAVDEVEKKVSSQPKPAPIDLAMRARAECLAALTAARRPAAATSTLGRSDELLSELSSMGDLAPVRDDRGVVITLRRVFQGDEVAKEARERLAGLGRVAQAHPGFPVQVLVHSAPSGGDAGRDAKRGASVARVLAEGGAVADKILVHAAGGAQPVVESSGGKTRERNERVEIIFVDPGG